MKEMHDQLRQLDKEQLIDIILKLHNWMTQMAERIQSLEATLMGHHGTSKIMSSQKSVSKREGHLIKKKN